MQSKVRFEVVPDAMRDETVSRSSARTDRSRALLAGKTIRTEKVLGPSLAEIFTGYHFHSQKAQDGNGYISWLEKKRGK